MTTWLPLRPSDPERSGGYDLVEVDVPLGKGPLKKIWYHDETGDVVHEDLSDERRFAAIIMDLDGLIIDSESPTGYFSVCWRALFREAGIKGTDEGLEILRRLVYRWEDDLLTSVTRMVSRIEQGVDTEGGALFPKEKQELDKLITDNVLYRWGVMTDWFDFGDDIHDHDVVSTIVADRKEQIGQAMLMEDPSRVLKLAPILPGVKKLFEAIPTHIIIALASASRVETIMSILEAHAKVGNGFLLERFNGFIFGEGDYGGNTKPHRRFYEAAGFCVGVALHDRGMIPPGGLAVEDMLYIGDVIARTTVGDISMTRKGMYHIVLQQGMDINAFGPRAAVVSDFPALLDMVGGKESINNATLRRLALTL